jgi:3-oxoacyl-[acyl-carrier-protein] synthase II
MSADPEREGRSGSQAAVLPVTGMGAVCAAGEDLEEILASFRAGRSACAPQQLSSSLPPLPVFASATPDGPDDENRTLTLGYRAVAAALQSAHLEALPQDSRVGVCMGTTVACQLNDFDFYSAYRSTHAAPMAPVDRYLKGSLADAVARRVGAHGPRLTVANACSSSADAIGVARSWLLTGRCDLVIAGGADELNRVPCCGFHAMGLASPDPVVPFDRRRNGLNLGEGAAALVLETPEHARRRGARWHVGLLGYGAACDAHHMTAPHPEGRGLAKAIREALAQSGLAPERIDFVNAHGTGTKENDRIEGRLLARTFGGGVRFLSTKGFTGHTLGAAGALEAVFTAAALLHGWLPASAGFEEADPEIGVTPLRALTPVDGPFALSTSLAFGGMNAALVFGRAT